MTSSFNLYCSLLLNDLETEHQIKSKSASRTTLNSTAASLASEYPASEATSYCSSFRDDGSLAHFSIGESTQELDQVINDIAIDQVVTKDHVKTMLRDRQKHEQEISEIRRKTDLMTKQSLDDYFRRSMDRRGLKHS